MNSSQKPKLSGREYEAGFETKVDSITFEKGLNEEVVRRISSQKKEPRFLLACDLFELTPNFRPHGFNSGVAFSGSVSGNLTIAFTLKAAHPSPNAFNLSP